MPASAPPPPPLIGALLRMSWERVRVRMLEGLHARGFTDLAPAHLAVLQYPSPDDIRPSELAARTGMTKQALNYLLNQIEQLDYVERRPDPDDPRAKRVFLTDRGRAMVAAVRDIVGDIEAEWEREVGVRDFALLRATLVRLADAGPPPDDAAPVEPRGRDGSGAKRAAAPRA